jgi:hypothetical protein
MKKLLLALFLSCLAVANIAYARLPVPLVNVIDADLPVASGKARSVNDVGAAVQRAADRKGWTIEIVSPGVMVGTLVVHGKHTIKADITFSERTLSIKYKDSVNMHYGTDSDGKPIIHPFYMHWVDHLLQAVRLELTQP